MPRPLSILYIANIRLPTEKAHGIAIMKMCEALARAGASVRLVVSRRYTTLPGDPFVVYDLKERFALSRLWVVDLFPLQWVRRGVAFVVESATFYLSLSCWLVFQSRKQLVYTRDIAAVGVAWLLGYPVVYECHALAKRRGFYFLVRRATRVVVISQALKAAFVHAGFSPEQVLVAPSGVDVALFAAAPSRDAARRMVGIPEEEFVAVYTGAFTTMGADKGLYDVFDALKLTPEVRVVAVGGAPYDLERYAREAAVRGVMSRVRLVGYVPQATLALYNAAADVLLMPFPDLPHYRHHMSPMKMIEYMASRRPVIATDLPTIREVVSEELAVIVPPGDSKALAAALEALRADPARGERLAATAFGAVGRFSWDERAKNVLEFIR